MRRRVLALLGLPGLIALGFPATGAQAATPLCFGQPATIVGTAGPDRLIGQSGVADVIWGGGGDDYILGGDYYSEDAVPGRAADLLCGEVGNDTVQGGPGPDKLNGGDGDDHVDGAYGNDTVQGNAGNDVLVDESMADNMSGNEIMRGGGGNDRIYVGFGLDKAYGDAGNDTIIDTECSTSYLYGGTGGDYIESYESSFEGGETCATGAKDYVYGDAGHDRALVNKYDAVTGVEALNRVS
jgi:Ca2+-binding RTX toxin-like protein